MLRGRETDCTLSSHSANLQQEMGCVCVRSQCWHGGPLNSGRRNKEAGFVVVIPEVPVKSSVVHPSPRRVTPDGEQSTGPSASWESHS